MNQTCSCCRKLRNDTDFIDDTKIHKNLNCFVLKHEF